MVHGRCVSSDKVFNTEGEGWRGVRGQAGRGEDLSCGLASAAGSCRGHGGQWAQCHQAQPSCSITLAVNTITTLNIGTLETEALSGSMHEKIANHHIFSLQSTCVPMSMTYICRLECLETLTRLFTLS